MVVGQRTPAGGDPASVPIASGAVDAAIEVLKATSYNLFPKRISIGAPTATAYFWMVRSVGRVCTPLSRRETTLLVVPILAATSSCVIPTAVRAATRSATRTCNVRSALSGRTGLFLCAPITEATFLAKICERSSMAVALCDVVAKMLPPMSEDAHWPFGRTGADLWSIPRVPAWRSLFAFLLHRNPPRPGHDRG